MTQDPDYGITQADPGPAIEQTCATHRPPGMTADSPRTGVIRTPHPPALKVEVRRDSIVRPPNAAVVVETHPAADRRQDPADPVRRRAPLTVDITRPPSAMIQRRENPSSHTNPHLPHIEMIGVPPEVVPPELRPLRIVRPGVILSATKTREKTGLVAATTGGIVFYRIFQSNKEKHVNIKESRVRHLMELVQLVFLYLHCRGNPLLSKFAEVTGKQTFPDTTANFRQRHLTPSEIVGNGITWHQSRGVWCCEKTHLLAPLLFFRHQHHFVFWQKWYPVKVQKVNMNHRGERRQQLNLVNTIKIYLPRRGNPLLFFCSRDIACLVEISKIDNVKSHIWRK